MKIISTNLLQWILVIGSMLIRPTTGLANTNSQVNGTNLDSFWWNRKGLQQFDNKSYRQAYQDFLHALTSDPLRPEIQLNLALTFTANEEWARAEAAYRGALSELPEGTALRFAALFNLAGVLVHEHRIDEALAAYQAALEIDPNSLPVKTNIELLWQQGQGQGQDDSQQKDQSQAKSGQDKQDQKDQSNKPADKSKDKSENTPQSQAKEKPKPFQSQELTPQDVNNILNEIKNQEQSIRAQEYSDESKQHPQAAPGKDW